MTAIDIARPRHRNMQLAVLVLALGTATIASAATTTYWIDASKAAAASCGKTAATACPDYARLMGASGCPGACGCDTSGCMDNITSAAGPVIINIVGGTYHGDGKGHCIGVGFNRTSSTEVTLQCSDATGNYTPGACTIDGTGVTLNSQFALVTVDGNPSGCAADATTAYVRIQGLNIILPPAGFPALRSRSRANHYLARDMHADCSGSDGDCTIFGPNNTFETLIGNTVTNCGNGAFGCFGTANNNNVALVGNTLGPNWHGYQPYPANNDSITVQNSQRVLIDGNTAKGPQTNCIDVGQVSANIPTQDVIVRYNDTYDCGNTRGIGDWTGQVMKFSGDDPSSTNSTNFAVYKNVVRYTSAGAANRNGALWLTERMVNSDVWYNTLYGVLHDITDGSRSTILIQSTAAGGNMPVLYNLFDSPTETTACSGAQACTLSLSGGSSCTSTQCKWVGNGWFFAGQSAASGLISFGPSGLGALYFNADLTRVGGGAGFNSTGSNSGNFRADPHLVSPNGTHLADYKLTASSTSYIDVGNAFCHASSAGSGNTITVTCSGSSTDPRHYFPQPSDYYALANGDCAGRGVRTAEANGSTIGCFDIQIEGCGGSGGLGNLPNVRMVTAATSTTITFSGGSCSWASGAKVHVPWNGSAPDVGALEFGTPGLPAPTLIDVQPVG